MNKRTKRERDITLEWAWGYINVAEAAKKLKKSQLGTYIVLANALKQIHYEKKD